MATVEKLGLVIFGPGDGWFLDANLLELLPT